jgi:post-segregation antitoxin (ccd killing protein)
MKKIKQMLSYAMEEVEKLKALKLNIGQLIPTGVQA